MTAGVATNSYLQLCAACCERQRNVALHLPHFSLGSSCTSACCLTNIVAYITVKCQSIVGSDKMFFEVLRSEIFVPTLLATMLSGSCMTHHVAFQCKSMWKHLGTTWTGSTLLNVHRSMHFPSLFSPKTHNTVCIFACEHLVHAFNVTLHNSPCVSHKVVTNKATELVDCAIHAGSLRGNMFHSQLNIQLLRDGLTCIVATKHSAWVSWRLWRLRPWFALSTEQETRHSCRNWLLLSWNNTLSPIMTTFENFAQKLVQPAFVSSMKFHTGIQGWPWKMLYCYHCWRWQLMTSVRRQP